VLHRGCIWAESDGIGKGSVFSVRLPLSKVRAREGTELYTEETD
jgi:signal transduction histidine kinase